MASVRAAVILAIFVVVTLVLIPWQWSALKFRAARRKRFPHRYHKWLCRLFGIRITVIGTPIQDRGVLMVSNHTSYFDIIVLSGAARVSFVAKQDVNSWPFFGTLARLQETVFVKREARSQTGVARDEIRERLRQGDALVLFPEGTSDDGNAVLPFRSALMGAAEAEVGTGDMGQVEHVPVQPVSVSYVGLHGIPMGRENRPLFAWYGDMELVPHLWEALKSGPLDAVIEFHPPMTVDSIGGRKALAVAAERIVREGQVRALAGLDQEGTKARHASDDGAAPGLEPAAA
jgi:1-acyl-sn-glycerol-3-phosphate acyltransferase